MSLVSSEIRRADNKFKFKDIYGNQTMSVPEEVFDGTKDLLRSMEQHFAKIADNNFQAKQKDVLSSSDIRSDFLWFAISVANLKTTCWTQCENRDVNDHFWNHTFFSKLS